MEKIVAPPQESSRVPGISFQRDQLKVIMNLPVRLVSNDQVYDVLPMVDTAKETIKQERLKAMHTPRAVIAMSPNEMIDFFKPLEYGELLTPIEMTRLFNVALGTIRLWGEKGILKRHFLNSSLCLYKRSEIPENLKQFIIQENG